MRLDPNEGGAILAWFGHNLRQLVRCGVRRVCHCLRRLNTPNSHDFATSIFHPFENSLTSPMSKIKMTGSGRLLLPVEFPHSARGYVTVYLFRAFVVNLAVDSLPPAPRPVAPVYRRCGNERAGGRTFQAVWVSARLRNSESTLPVFEISCQCLTTLWRGIAAAFANSIDLLPFLRARDDVPDSPPACLMAR